MRRSKETAPDLRSRVARADLLRKSDQACGQCRGGRAARAGHWLGFPRSGRCAGCRTRFGMTARGCLTGHGSSPGCSGPAAGPSILRRLPREPPGAWRREARLHLECVTEHPENGPHQVVLGLRLAGGRPVGIKNSLHLSHHLRCVVGHASPGRELRQGRVQIVVREQPLVVVRRSGKRWLWKRHVRTHPRPRSRAGVDRHRWLIASWSPARGISYHSAIPKNTEAGTLARPPPCCKPRGVLLRPICDPLRESSYLCRKIPCTGGSQWVREMRRR